MAKDHLDAEAIRAAQGVLDAFMTAFNALATSRLSKRSVQLPERAAGERRGW